MEDVRDAEIVRYVGSALVIESDEEVAKKDAALTAIRNIFHDWVGRAAQTTGAHTTGAQTTDFPGAIFVSGSHHIGVRDVHADIDAVCLCPSFFTDTHFFSRLKVAILAREEVTELVSITNAFVPLISFKFNGISIDLIYARMSTNRVPTTMVQLLDDRVLGGLSDRTVRALDGPRVAETIRILLHRHGVFDRFIVLLRIIRTWAKSRGIYGGKMGYLSGVSCCILTAFVCLPYPTPGLHHLLFLFFHKLSNWKWPNPISLTHSTPKNNTGLPSSGMSVFTPVVPTTNVTHGVSPESMAVIIEELKRGESIVNTGIARREPVAAYLNKLLEPSDFFAKYNHFAVCRIVGNVSDAKYKNRCHRWVGYVESQLRHFTKHLRNLPIASIRLHPVPSITSSHTHEVSYYIGFHNVGGVTNLDQPARAFTNFLRSTYPDRTEHDDDIQFHVDLLQC